MKPLCLFTEKQYSRNERHYSNGIDMHIWCGSLIVLPEVGWIKGDLRGVSEAGKVLHGELCKDLCNVLQVLIL